MNRPIEFRVWNGIEWIGIISAGNTPDTNDFNRWEDLVFCQYTGLKDKNDKKIFEGDILKETLHKNEFYYYTVEWGDDGWFLIMQDKSTNDWNIETAMNQEIESQPRMTYFYVGMEIVGNIFENKELLK